MMNASANPITVNPTAPSKFPNEKIEIIMKMAIVMNGSK